MISVRLLPHILQRPILTGKSEIPTVVKAADEADHRLAEIGIDERIDLDAKMEGSNGKKSVVMMMTAGETVIQVYNEAIETTTALGPDRDPDHRHPDGRRREGKIEIATEIMTAKSDRARIGTRGTKRRGKKRRRSLRLQHPHSQ